METRSKRRKTEPISDKIRRGEISVFVAVAEYLPAVFRTHVVPKLDLYDTFNLAEVSKFYNAAVWSVEAVTSMEEKATNEAKLLVDLDLKATFPALHAMAMRNNVKGMRALISSGVNLEQRVGPSCSTDPDTSTALQYAVKHSHPEAMKLLLEAGADVNARVQSSMPTEGPQGGQTCLFIALRNDDVGTMSLLLEAGADVDMKVKSRENWVTALQHCCASVGPSRVQAVKILLDAGADPNNPGSFHSPLHTTVVLTASRDIRSDVGLKIVELLLEAGADPLLHNSEGKTPLEYGLESILPLDPLDARDKKMITLLQQAMKR